MRSYFKVYTSEDNSGREFYLYQDEDTGKVYVDELEEGQTRSFCSSESFSAAVDFIINHI